MVNRKYSLVLVIMLVLSVNIVFAEQTVKTIELPLKHESTPANNVIYYRNVTVDFPDGIDEILSMELILSGDYGASTSVFGGFFVGDSVVFCSPQSWTTPPYNVSQYETIFDCSDVVKSANWKGSNIPLEFAWLSLGTINPLNIKPKFRITYYNKPTIIAKIYGTEYQCGDNGTVFLQLLDDDSKPMNNALCYVSIYYPNKTVLVDDTDMLYLLNSDGLYYYDLTIPDATGAYMISAHCDYEYNLTYSAVVHDSYVSSSSPSSNYGNLTYMLSGHFISEYYSHLEFNLSNVSTDEILKADLFLYQTASFSNPLNATIQRITQDWNETNITYNNRPSNDGVFWNSTTLSTSNGWKKFTITDLVKNWINGSYVNHGMIINYTKGTFNNYKAFYTKEISNDYTPRLVITYNEIDSISTIRGSGELHVNGFVDDIKNSITDIPERVWNYSNRTLTNYNQSKILELLYDINNSNNNIYSYLQNIIYPEIDNIEELVGNLSYDIENNFTFILNQMNDNFTSTLNSIENINTNLTNISDNVNIISLYLENVNASLYNEVISNRDILNNIHTNVSDIRNYLITMYSNLVSYFSNATIATLSNMHRVVINQDYTTELTLYNPYQSAITPDYIPTISIYDETGAAIVTDANMSLVVSGVYNYNYTVASSANPGTWTSIAKVTINGKTKRIYDKWYVISNPTQVEIEVVSLCGTEVCANLRITNEGSTNYEYIYNYWTTDNALANYESGDVADRGQASKLIPPGETFSSRVCLQRPLTDNLHYFRARTYYGEYSFATDSFTNNLRCDVRNTITALLPLEVEKIVVTDAMKAIPIIFGSSVMVFLVIVIRRKTWERIRKSKENPLYIWYNYPAEVNLYIIDEEKFIVELREDDSEKEFGKGKLIYKKEFDSLEDAKKFSKSYMKDNPEGQEYNNNFIEGRQDEGVEV